VYSSCIIPRMKCQERDIMELKELYNRGTSFSVVNNHVHFCVTPIGDGRHQVCSGEYELGEINSLSELFQYFLPGDIQAFDSGSIAIGRAA